MSRGTNNGVVNGFLNGKTCLVTGATSGIGKLTALKVANAGARLIIASRNEAKCASTTAWVRKESGNDQVEYAVVDLSDREDILRFAGNIKERYQNLDVLINNAGEFFLTRRENSAGIEMTFALNHLGYFMPTLLLLDLLLANGPARIINVASGSHRNAEMQFDDLQFERLYRPGAAYAQSKLANILFTYELSKRLDPAEVTVNALHPGFVATDIASDNAIIGWLIAPFMRLVGKSPEEGARTPFYLAASEAVNGVTGKYFVDNKPIASAPQSHDEGAAKRLWEISLELTGLEDPL